MKLHPNRLALLILLAAAACSPQPAPTPAPTPAPAPIVAPQPSPPPMDLGKDWTSWPIAPGNWVYRQDARGSIALFGPQGDDAILTIRCDRERNRVFLSRAGKASGKRQMVVRTTSKAETLKARPTDGAPPYSAVALDPDSYLLDRIVFSRGRFAVETSGLPPVAIPTWPEFTRVVEDCRS